MTTGIYKITNKINGHYYIGRSIRIEHRFREHISNAKYFYKDKNMKIT